jgi:hypothetical protein
VAFNEKYVTVTGGGLHDGSSEANAWTFDEAIANVSAGDRVNVKLGTHTCSSSTTTSGTYTNPIAVRGYVSTIGDLDDLPLADKVGGTDIPKVTTSSGTQGFRGTWTTHNHLEFEGTAAFASAWYFGNNSVVRSCRIINTSSTSYDCCNAGTTVFDDCYFYSPTQYSRVLFGTNATLTNCLIKGNNTGNYGTNARRAINCIFSNHVKAVETEGGADLGIYGCTFVDCTTAIRIQAYPYGYIISNCYFSNCGTAILGDTYGANNYANILVTSCCYQNVTTQISGIDSQVAPVTDASDEFVDSANNDFTLKTTSNGYSSQHPQTFAEYVIANGRDIGAIQHVSIVDPTTSESTGTQIYPFRQWAQQDPELIIHPLRSN